MHIVALTGGFYPNIIAPSACIKPYLTELAKENDVVVICPVTDYHFQSPIVAEGIEIHYVWDWINRINIWAKENSAEHRLLFVSKVASLLIRGINYLKEIFWPEPYDSLIVKSYLKELMAINNGKKIDVVLSVTFPFDTHVAALAYKRRYPEVKWLTYTTDPLAYNEANPVVFWKKGRAVEVEKRIYDTCDKCLITEELFDNLVDDFEISQEKIATFPYLIETDNVKFENDNPHVGSPRALYAGYLFFRVRDPQTLLNVFARLDDVDLYLYVSGDRKCRRLLNRTLPENIHLNGLVPRDEYFRLLSEADVLINLSNNASLQAPHKLMELVSTGKPVINFYYYKNAGYEIIEKYPLGINIPNNGELAEMTELIDAFIKENSQKRLQESEIKEIFRKYHLTFQLERLKTLIGC